MDKSKLPFLLCVLIFSYSCATQHKLKRYLANDETCTCEYRNEDFIVRDSIDLTAYNIAEIRKNIRDTLLHTKNYTITLGANDEFFVINKHSLKADIFFSQIYDISTGKILGYDFQYEDIYIGDWIADGGKEKGNDDYVVEATQLNIDSIASLYPICWKEACELLRAKIGKYKLIRITKHNYTEPNSFCYKHFWWIEAENSKTKPKQYFFINAQTGEVNSGIKNGTVSTDDQI